MLLSLLLFISLVSPMQCSFLNISLAIVNAQTVIACGLSIDIYPSFDPAQVTICPYVFAEKDNIQLIHINISYDNNHQIKIESNPPLVSPPNFSIKSDNNSFISPLHIDQNSTYYLSFSSELTCRISLSNNETICFYYPVSASFVHIEYHYDEIEQGSLILPEKTRINFYIIFVIISIFVGIICCFSIYMVCTNEFSLRHTTQLEEIIDSHMTKQEAAKQSADLPQDGAIGHPVLAEHMTVRESFIPTGDA